MTCTEGREPSGLAMESLSRFLGDIRRYPPAKSQMPDLLSDYNEFQKRYEAESDRAVAILAAAYLDSFLENYLRSTLVESKTTDKLFVGFGPLATFSGKSDVAFSIGLFPEHTHNDLGIVRKIRNAFAHDHVLTSFNDSPIRDYCANLSCAVGHKRSDGTLRKTHGAKSQYLNSVFWILIHMETEMQRKPRLQIPKFRFEEVVDE